jgi:hypothetical protein
MQLCEGPKSASQPSEELLKLSAHESVSDRLSYNSTQKNV